MKALLDHASAGSPLALATGARPTGLGRLASLVLVLLALVPQSAVDSPVQPSQFAEGVDEGARRSRDAMAAVADQEIDPANVGGRDRRSGLVDLFRHSTAVKDDVAANESAPGSGIGRPVRSKPDVLPVEAL